jgi:hypothetical protein
VRRLLLAGGVLGVLLLLAAWALAPSAGEGGAVDAQAQASAGQAPGRGAGSPELDEESPALASASSPQEVRRRERKLWEKRLERAEETLQRYQQATRYPHESRPAREHPDQMRHEDTQRTQALDKDDPASDVRLRLKQSAVFLAGGQSVDFSVRCESREGEARPCEVASAQVREAETVPGAGGLPPVPLAFAAGPDGWHTARFTPAAEGFALFEGTLRADVEVTSGATRGRATLDIITTGNPPAAFTGQVRESLERGSLVLRLPLQVRKPGRYVIAARVDDADGKDFAYLSFNEELRAGRQEVELTVFGLLVRDEKPRLPLTLRDVDGFLLRESGDPDRELLLPLQGPVHTTKGYPLTAFSDAEWTSEERQRYLTEYGKDVKQAQAHLETLASAP